MSLFYLLCTRVVKVWERGEIPQWRKAPETEKTGHGNIPVNGEIHTKFKMCFQKCNEFPSFRRYTVITVKEELRPSGSKEDRLQADA